MPNQSTAEPKNVSFLFFWLVQKNADVQNAALTLHFISSPITSTKGQKTVFEIVGDLANKLEVSEGVSPSSLISASFDLFECGVGYFLSLSF